MNWLRTAFDLLCALQTDEFHQWCAGNITKNLSQLSRHEAVVSDYWSMSSLSSLSLSSISSDSPRDSLIDDSLRAAPLDPLPSLSADEGRPSETHRPSNWRSQMIDAAVRDVERAEFVALDLGELECGVFVMWFVVQSFRVYFELQ